jgi:hypothetical protein
MSLIVIKATWDPEASVWVAESEDVPGLITEADTMEALQKKLPGIIQDLLQGTPSALSGGAARS